MKKVLKTALKMKGVTKGKEYDIDDLGAFRDDKGMSRLAKAFLWVEEDDAPSQSMINITLPIQAERYNAGKPELSYLLSAPYAAAGVCETYSFGAIKYSRDNWKQGFPREQLVDSLLRHLMAAENGEVNDPESGLNHLDHVLWNATVLADQYNGKRDEANAKSDNS